MANLPNNNITTTMVSQALGYGSNNVGILCNAPSVNKWSAKKPRINSNAGFPPEDILNNEILINYITKYDAYESKNTQRGYIHYIRKEDFSKISGVTPDWNILDDSILGEAPIFKLGDFRGYDHNAIEPKIKDRYLKIYENTKIAVFYVHLEGLENLDYLLPELGNPTVNLTYKYPYFEKVSKNEYKLSVTLNTGIFLDDTIEIINELNATNHIYNETQIANKLIYSKMVYDIESRYFIKKEDVEYTDYRNNFDKDFPVIFTPNTPMYESYQKLRPKLFSSAGIGATEIQYPDFIVNGVHFYWSTPGDPSGAKQFYYNVDCKIVGVTGNIQKVRPRLELHRLNEETNTWGIVDGQDLNVRYLKVGADGGFVKANGSPEDTPFMDCVLESTSRPFTNYIDDGIENQFWANYALKLTLHKI